MPLVCKSRQLGALGTWVPPGVLQWKVTPLEEELDVLEEELLLEVLDEELELDDELELLELDEELLELEDA